MPSILCAGFSKAEGYRDGCPGFQGAFFPEFPFPLPFPPDAIAVKQTVPVREGINSPRFPRSPLRGAAASARLLTRLPGALALL